MNPTTYDGQLALLIDPDWTQDGSAARGRGILFMAAHLAQPADVNRMATDGRGVCTVTINEGTATRLRLYPQGSVPPGRETPYLVNSIESTRCTETGISAGERAQTLRSAGNPDVIADDLVTPGHIMVQVARNVLREGGTLPEIANALLSAHRIARFAAWTDILDDEGELASAADCRALAARLALPCFDGPEAIVFARAALPTWDAAVKFSHATFG